jgi:hypothetical protein
MADGSLQIGWKVWSKLFSHQILFYLPKPKIHDFNLEKHTPLVVMNPKEENPSAERRESSAEQN